ncbi:hypothetical protein [Myxococcus stipitatus]|nr:hypothetical protein [Myxococcus stipitatus]
MDNIPSLASAIKDSPAGAMLAVCVLALGWLGRAYIAQMQAHTAAMQAQHDAHLQTAMLVAPLATKLVDALGLMERAVLNRHGGPS